MIRKTIIFIFSFLITLVCIEIFLQISEIDSLSKSINHPVLGSVLKRNEPIIAFNEGFMIGEINNEGYYGPSYPKQKDSSTFRIALMGDSYVEGHQLFDRQHFRAIIENRLYRLTRKKIEVLNFGRSGFNLNDSYCYYKNFASNYSPNITLFFISNEDLTDQRTSNRRPFCYIENDSLKIDYSYSQMKNYKFRVKTSFFRGKSILLSWIFHSIELIKKGYFFKIIFDKFYIYLSKKTEPENNHDSNSLEFGNVSKKIILELNSSSNVLFVAKEKLNNSIYDFFEKEKINIFFLNKVYENKYHYWQSTKKIGHWNYEAHIEIGDQIAQFLKRKIEKK